jgi:diaminopimelate decarboxylase
MTLADLLPSLRTSLRPRLDTGIWPVTARWGTHGDLLVGGVRMSALAAAYGTPAHVVDEADVRARCAEYVATFGADAVAYSAKAGLTVGAGRWIAEQGLGCYVGSADELRTALLAGFRPPRIVLYGTGKSVMDLDAAYACGAAVVVGTLAEVEAVAARAPLSQRVHLRVISSGAGRGRCRYGLRLGSGTTLAAINAILASPNLSLAGLDCSVGHQLSRFQAFERCLREAMAFCAVVRSRCGVPVSALNLGGGHAVAYADGDEAFALTAFASRIRAMLRLSAERYGIDEPRLTVSPGRAIVARAGVTLHRVISVSVTDSADRLAVAVDGGLPDCATGAECAGRHTAELVGRVSQAPTCAATVVGDPDEGRTVLVPSIDLPDDIAAGDLLAVAGTGAYHHRRDPFVGRPPVLGVGDGLIRTLARRETFEDLLLRTRQ